MNNYLSPEDIAIAEKNGISYAAVQQRFYRYGWSKERAMTQPMGRRLWNQYKDECLKLGISCNYFFKRIRNGMTPEEAANRPKLSPGSKYKNLNPKITKEIIQEAEANGIAYPTLANRVYKHKWTIEKAKTTPVDVKRRRNV